MGISEGPFITCFLTVLFLAIYVCFAIYVRKDAPYGGIKFTFLVMLLLLVRMMVPFNFPFTVNIVSYTLLPPFSRILYHYIGNFRFGTAEVLFTVWIAGSIIKLLDLFYGQWRYRRWLQPFIIRELSKYPELEEILLNYGGGRMKVCILPVQTSPRIIGLRHPILVLPESALLDEGLQYICCHEIEHYRNYDLWLKLLLELVLCVQWFNPVAYFFRRKLTLVFELSNDAKVVAFSSEEERLEYMDCILKMADDRKRSSKAWQGLAFFSTRKLDLGVRVKRLMVNEKKVRKIDLT